MTAVVTTCRDCGTEFTPDRRTILRGEGKFCPAMPAPRPRKRAYSAGRTARSGAAPTWPLTGRERHGVSSSGSCHRTTSRRRVTPSDIM
jgi:hypothetical protein